MLRQIRISEISPSSFQPRQRFSDEALEELKESIRVHGLIQPLVVRGMEDGGYELIAGERRYRACKLLGLKDVPAVVRSADNRTVLEMALIENLQREDLNPVEEAKAYMRLAREFNLKQEEIAQKVGKNRTTVANAIRLLDLDPAVQSLLEQGLISSGHAKAVLSLKGEEEQRAVAKRIVAENLNVRDTERLVRSLDDDGSSMHSAPGGSSGDGSSSGGGQGPSDLEPYLKEIQARLLNHFKTNVRIQRRGSRGKIEIEFHTDNDLDRILGLLDVDFSDDGLES